MHEVVDEKRSPSKKPFIFYAIIALLIIMFPPPSRHRQIRLHPLF